MLVLLAINKPFLRPFLGGTQKEKNGVRIFAVKTSGLMLLYEIGIAAGVSLIFSSHYLIGLGAIVIVCLAHPRPIRADESGIRTGTILFRKSMNWTSMKEIFSVTNKDSNFFLLNGGIAIKSYDGKQIVINNDSYDVEEITEFITNRAHIPTSSTTSKPSPKAPSTGNTKAKNSRVPVEGQEVVPSSDRLTGGL